MWFWFAVSLGMGLVAAVVAIAMHPSTEGIYVGVVERDAATGSGRDGLQVRAYVHETLVRELPAPSRLNGRMLIRETNTSVPLMFVRVPAFVPPPAKEAGEWAEPDSPVLPVIFRFNQTPGLAVRPGQLVDVYVGAR